METLKTEPIKIQQDRNIKEYQLSEKDHGDEVVYDISRNGHYLLTLSKGGDILFMNMDAPAEERQLFNLSFLNQFIDLIKQRK